MKEGNRCVGVGMKKKKERKKVNRGRKLCMLACGYE